MPCAIHTGEPGDDGGVRSPEGWEDASPVQTAGRTYRPYVQSAVREDRQGGAGQEEGDREAWRRERRERRGEEREERRGERGEERRERRGDERSERGQRSERANDKARAAVVRSRARQHHAGEGRDCSCAVFRGRLRATAEAGSS
jgi:hypothetical protein